MMDSKSKKYCHSPKLRARGIGAFLGGSTVRLSDYNKSEWEDLGSREFFE